MAGGDDNLGCCGLVQGLCGLVEAFLLPRSGGFPARNPSYSSSQVWRTGSPWDVGISSGPPVPRARNPSYSSSQVWRTGSPWDVGTSSGPPVPRARNSPPQQSDDDDDDDCVIVAEKGQVACRDFPHSRHLCSNMPFGTTSHEKHCTMCYCFVCDAPAPCSYWGRGLSVEDHCHATDKETKWKTLRQAFRQRSNGSGTSNGHTAQISYPLALTVSAPRAHSAAGAGRGTSNAHTAQISHPLAITVGVPRVSSATRVQSGTSNAHTAQISHPVALTVSAPSASSATRVQSGASNGHSAQVTHLVEPTVSAPRPHPAARAGRGTSNAHTALITHPVEPCVSAARPYSAERTGRGTSNAHTSQITHPVDQPVSGTRAYPAGRTGRGISNVHNAQITRPVEQTAGAPRVYPAARAGSDSSNAHSGQITYPATTNGYLTEPDAPEGATVYVGNLPYHIDNERLKLSFQHAGVVLFSKVIYNRETGRSRGFGYVTMNTVQEAETAVRIYHGSEVYGRPLTVNIAAPRGSARVDTARRQSGSPLRIFVCNLPTQVDRFRLEELFSKHGKVVDAKVVYERREGDWCSRGFGFVTMATEEESYNAIHALNKQILEGHALGVKVARERPNVVPTVSAPRAYPATRARSGTVNAYSVQVTHRLDPTASARRPGEHSILSISG